MISKKSMFEALFEENIMTNLELVELRQKIFNLENEFRKKYSSEVFKDYCKISELVLEELLECVDISFNLGFSLKEDLKKLI